MIEPGNCLLDRVHLRAFRCGRPPQQQDRNPKLTGGGNLAVGCSAAAVFRHNDIDRVGLQQSHVLRFRERAAAKDVVGVRDLKWRVYRVNAADQITVLRCAGERGDLLTAERQEDTPRLGTECPERAIRTLDFGPAIAADRLPSRALQREQGRAGLLSGLAGVRGDRRRIGVGRVDERADGSFAQVTRQSCAASKPPPTDRHRLGQRRDRTSGKRDGQAPICPRRETDGELAGFNGAAED